MDICHIGYIVTIQLQLYNLIRHSQWNCDPHLSEQLKEVQLPLQFYCIIMSGHCELLQADLY